MKLRGTRFYHSLGLCLIVLTLGIPLQGSAESWQSSGRAPEGDVGSCPDCEIKARFEEKRKAARAVQEIAKKLEEDARKKEAIEAKHEAEPRSCFAKALKKSKNPALNSMRADEIKSISGGESLAALQRTYGADFTHAKTAAVEKKFKADYFGGQKVVDDRLVRMLGLPEARVHRDLGITAPELTEKEKRFKIKKGVPMIGGAYLLVDSRPGAKKNAPPLGMVIQSRVCKNPSTGKVTDARGMWNEQVSCPDPRAEIFQVIGIYDFRFDPKKGVITLEPETFVECGERITK